MPRELLEGEILKPVSITLNPKTLKIFDGIVGKDMRSKKVRQLIQDFIEANNEMVQAPDKRS